MLRQHAGLFTHISILLNGTVVQWNDLHSEGQGNLKCTGSREDWASIQVNGSQTGGLSDRSFPLGGIL